MVGVWTCNGNSTASHRSEGIKQNTEGRSRQDSFREQFHLVGETLVSDEKRAIELL